MTNYQVPRGTQDVYGEEIKKWHYIEQLIRDFCAVYNYQEVRTPIFEHTEVFKRGNDSSDMVNKEMYTFLDSGDRSLTLRPEGTAGIVRSYVENKRYGDPDQPLKMYYIAPNFRYERPQKGRMRIHNQFGTEVIGVKNPLIDSEIISLGYSFVSVLGLKDLKVLINTLGDAQSRNDYKEALLKYFKPYITDLCRDCQRRYQQNPLRILDCKVDAKSEVMKNAPKLSDYLNQESKEYFNDVLKSLDELGIPYEIDEKLVRGLDYYGHTVFEVVSINPDMGSQSTVFAGGRYDNFVEYFGGPSVSGVGFGMGVERLLVALDSEKVELPIDNGIDLYLMPLETRFQSYALAIASQTRAFGFKTDMDFVGKNLKGMFKTADRKQAKVVGIIGEDEFNETKVTLKNIKTQQQISIDVENIIEVLDKWLEEEKEC